MRLRPTARPAALLGAAGLILGGAAAAPASAAPAGAAAVPGFTVSSDVQCAVPDDFSEDASLDVYLDFDNSTSATIDVVVTATYAPGTAGSYTADPETFSVLADDVDFFFTYVLDEDVRLVATVGNEVVYSGTTVFSDYGCGLGEYVETDPTRVMTARAVGPGGTTTLTIPSVPEGATAAAVNLTASGVTANTYVSACLPTTSTASCKARSVLNTRGPDTANFLVLPLGGPRRDQIKLYNNAGSVKLTADLGGFMLANAVPFPVAPALAGATTTAPAPDAAQVTAPSLRVLHAAGTRPAAAPAAALGGSVGDGLAAALVGDGRSRYDERESSRVMPPRTVAAGATTLLTVPGVPAGATAVALNVTVAGVTANTYVSACPPEVATGVCDDGSIINSAGPDTANFVVLPLGGPDGDQVKFYNNAGSVTLIGDLQGFMVKTIASGNAFRPGAVSQYVGTEPRRVLQPVVLGAAGSTTLTLPDVPAGATAVALNVTAAGVRANTYVSACPADVPTSVCDDKSIINSKGADTANFVVVRLGGPGGNQVKLYNNAGSTTLVADLMGWMVTDAV